MKSAKTVIKKVKKKGHPGVSHGGQWKVAYADFVTAMMAFFLLMWLVTTLSPEKKKSMAQYFKEDSIFQNTGTGFWEKQNGIMGDSGTLQLVPRGKETGGITREEFRDRLKRDIELKLAEVKDQILVEIFEGGVRIQMIDKEGSPMFALGSPELTPTAKKVLKVIAAHIKELENEVAIEGHTDALPYSTNHYTNWELSTERASSARKELEAEGLNTDRLVRVAGYAAKEPLIHNNPADPRNRRISIVLLFKPKGQHRKPPLGQAIDPPLAQDLPPPPPLGSSRTTS